MPEVRAQEAPSIVDLSVIPSGEGVSASCEFGSYGTDSGYSMDLYLNQVREDGSVAEIAMKWIAPTADGQGVAITDEKQVEPGIYKATLVLDGEEGGAAQVNDFRNSQLYDVSIVDGRYVVTLHQEGEEEPEPEDKPEVGEKPEPGDEPEVDERPEVDSGTGQKERPKEEQDFSCRHSVVYRIVKAANPDEDAVLSGECSKCQEVLSYSFVPNSAYAAFLEAAVYAIQNAQEGEVLIETERWISFNQPVFDVIANRPEVSVTVRYRYEGKQYEVTIPAGADINGLTDENGFCGFRHLDQIFGGREIA